MMPRRGSPEVIHALQNQISVIIGFADLLAQDLAPDDRRSADVLEIRKAARDALTLVHALLEPPEDPDEVTP
jgi:signal transduction histidine kinase